MKAGSVSKFIFGISAALAAAVSNDTKFLAIILAAILTAFYTWGGTIQDLKKAGKAALWFFALVFLLHLFSGSGKDIFAIWFLNATINGAAAGLLYGLKVMIFVFSAYTIFFKVDPMELIKPFERILKHTGGIGRIVSAFLISFSLAMRFLPDFAMQARTNVLAFRSRGYDFKGGLLKKLKAVNLLMISIFVGTFKKAESVSIALELKGYPLRYRRAVFPPARIGLFDAFIYIVSLSMIVAGWVSK